MDEYYTCPVCGQKVQLSCQSKEFGDDSLPPLYWGEDGKRKGVCQQLDETGQRVLLHFVVQYHQEPYTYHQNGQKYHCQGGEMIGHNLWRKRK